MPPEIAGHAVRSVVIPTRVSVALCRTAYRALNAGSGRRCRRGGKPSADVVFAQLASISPERSSKPPETTDITASPSPTRAAVKTTQSTVTAPLSFERNDLRTYVGIGLLLREYLKEGTRYRSGRGAFCNQCLKDKGYMTCRSGQECGKMAAGPRRLGPVLFKRKRPSQNKGRAFKALLEEGFSRSLC